MKITLINPPLEMKSRRWYPIGIGYIASVLLQNGFQVEIIDCIGDNLSRNDFINRIRQSTSNCFGIGGIVTAFSNVCDIIKYIRSIYPDAFIFAGNTVAYTIPEIILSQTSLDAVVCGEGEISTLDLLLAIRDNRSLDSIPGIIYKKAELGIQKNTERAPIANLDILPFPAWELMPIEKYFRNAGHRYCVISTVRGCPYQCTYCCKTFINYKVRYRSADSIMNELLDFNNRYGISTFYFFDDLSTVNKRRMIDFCKLKMDSELAHMSWTISARVNLVDEELIEALKQSKCEDIGFGIESFDQNILNSINKQIDLKQIESALDLCDKYRVNYSGSSFMIGAIEETSESIRKTSSFCQQRNLRYEPHYMTPFPGTPLYEYAVQKGLIKNELEYLHKLSCQGNTNYLLVNMTRNLSDDDLVRLRMENLYFPKVPRNVVGKLLSLVRSPRKIIELVFHLARLVASRTFYYRGSFDRYSNLWE